MKKLQLIRFIGLLWFVTIVATNLAWCQNSNRIYTTTSGEFILSWANVKANGEEANSVTRFSPYFNLQNSLHIDKSDKLGFFTGLNIRNVGFIYDDPTEVNTRYKLRTYNLGVPFAIKFGDLAGSSFFAGYELELPINFKEKTFINEDKEDKSSDWFSKRTPSFYHSLFAGFQGPYGLQVKFKYYMTNFVDQGYAANDGNGNTIYPYENLDAKVFYVSLSYQLFRNASFYYSDGD